MLHEMGHATGIDLERLVECAREAQSVLGRPLGSHVLTAGPVDWHRLERRHRRAGRASSGGSASEGERRSAEWVAGRLRELGAEDVAVEPYRGAATTAPRTPLLFALGALGSAPPGRRWPSPCSSSSTAAALRLLRRLLPAGDGANVTGRLPGARAAPADARPGGPPRRRPDRPRVRPAPAGRPATAGPAHRPARLARSAARAGLRRGGARAAPRPCAPRGRRRDRAPGLPRAPSCPAPTTTPAAWRRCWPRWRSSADDRPDGLEVLAVFPGGEEAGHGRHGRLAGRPISSTRRPRSSWASTRSAPASRWCSKPRAALWPVRYREADVAQVERAADDAGVALKRWRLGAWTDPVLARVRGLPAASVLSVKDGGFPHYHLPSDFPSTSTRPASRAVAESRWRPRAVRPRSVRPVGLASR